MPDDTLAPGLLILDRFRLKRVLGSGGMGSVWEASHLALGTEIAIKFLDAELSRRSDIRARFAREATAAARIKSANVVSILDYGFSEGGRGFIVMERLCGEDLGQHLARTYTMTPEELAPIITQACRGLGKAHALGIIHRDIKPENLFLHEEEDGIVVKLLDFGIAKHVEPAPDNQRTDTGQLLGTPLYMSPEQALGRPLDTRTDLYSLALVAYRCLAGRPPFIHRATGELIVAVSTEVPPLPSSFNASVPPALDAWFAAMLLKDPDARLCQTAASFAESFAAACAGAAPDTGAALGFSATLPGSDTPTLSEGSAVRSERWGPAPRSAARPRGRWRWALAVLPLGMAGLWVALRGAAPEAAPPVAAPRPSAPAPVVALEVRLAASPREATLYLDGQRLAGNPSAVARRADGSSHRLRAEAPGFEPAERDVTLDRDSNIALVPSAPPGAQPTPPAGPPQPAPTPPAGPSPAAAAASPTGETVAAAAAPSPGESAAPSAGESAAAATAAPPSASVANPAPNAARPRPTPAAPVSGTPAPPPAAAPSRAAPPRAAPPRAAPPRAAAPSGAEPAPEPSRAEPAPEPKAGKRPLGIDRSNPWSSP